MTKQLRCCFVCSLFLLLCTVGCGSDSSAGKAAPPDSSSSEEAKGDPGSSWDSTPQVLVPSHDGAAVLGNELISIDVSHTEEGYLMANYLGTADKVKFFIITPDDVRYTYDINKDTDWQTLPLTGGNGTYAIDVREHLEADLYTNLFAEDIEVSLKDEFLPFLYPNQYTWFTADSEAVAKAASLTSQASNGLEAVGSIYDYVINNVAYDTAKAASVESGYLPDVDETLRSGKGICFDYAALMTAMLRSQKIPTKLEIGYSGEIYHAWISTYLPEEGWVENVIQFDGKNWTLIDPTLAAENHAESVKDYIGDGTNYTVQYSR